jgi:hypothetical protein
MFLGPTVLIYVLLGVGVAVALYVSENRGGRGARWFNVLTALPFWPFYLPILLARGKGQPEGETTQTASPAVDEMTAAIHLVDGELVAALNSLDGWAEDVLARERGRIHELRNAWKAQRERIREMDRLLADPGPPAPITTPATPLSAETSERLRHSQQVRERNLDRLRQVRRRAYEELMATLAWVRELVSMIHLAKFTGAPASRAEELVAQIAAAVEGLSDATWQETTSEPVVENA